MSLVISCYVPTGIVMSADSRTTMRWKNDPGTSAPTFTNVVLSDSANKLFLLFGRFGVGTFGDAHVNGMPIAHYVAEFESRTGSSPPTTEAAARALADHFGAMAPKPAVCFLVAGYDDLTPFSFKVDALTGEIHRQNIGTNGVLDYGVGLGGDTAVVNRLLGDPTFLPAFQVMPLQDAVDFTRHLVRTTVEQLRFEPRFATVGGAIDTLVLEPGGAQWLSKKVLVARGGA